MFILAMVGSLDHILSVCFPHGRYRYYYYYYHYYHKCFMTRATARRERMGQRQNKSKHPRILQASVGNALLLAVPSLPLLGRLPERGRQSAITRVERGMA